jgi:hypothetical protein
VRPGIFQSAFSRGGLLVLLLYVALCLGYGYGLTQLTYAGEESQTINAERRASQLDSDATREGALWPWFVGVMYSVLFTSTLTHYYFDGFIWKVRHKENRQNLAMQVEAGRNAPQPVPSWWDAQGAVGPGKMLLRQSLYFGLPIALIMFTGWKTWTDSVKNPMAIEAHVKKAEELSKKGLEYQAQKEMESAIAACNNLLEIEGRMVGIRPTPSDYCLMSDLIYRKSRYYAISVGPAQGVPHRELLEGHRRELNSAIDTLRKALALPDEMGQFGHILAPNLTRADAEALAEAMQKEIGAIDKQLAVMASSKN